jgi:hypothetical protein
MNDNDKRFYCRAAVAALLLWIVLFSSGLLVDSAFFRQHVSANGQISLGNFALAILIYTPTNVAFLSVLCGFIGGCCSRIFEVGDLPEQLQKAADAQNPELVRSLTRRIAYLAESPWLSMLRGFITYIAAIAGILLVIGDPFANPTPLQYIRTAGIISLIAFVMGYDPTRFEELITKLTQWKPPTG